jgi:HAD superfamily hydrolase (TIGR01509 family)
MKLNIPAGDFAGYIFDLDGTLVDSMPLHYRTWDAALRMFGMTEALDVDLFYSLGGVNSQGVAAVFGKRYGLRLDPDEVMRVKEAMYFELIPELKRIEPVAAFAEKVAATHPVAVATGGYRDIALPALKAAKLDAIFKIIVTPADVPPGCGKPHPDMFLLAAKLAGVDPEKCLAFEDATPGLQAAVAAGMQVVHVPSRMTS